MSQLLELQLSPLAAGGVSLTLAVGFVASLHVWKLFGHQDEDRNNDETIKRRFVSTLMSCILGAILVVVLAAPASPGSEGKQGPGHLALSAPDLLGVSISPEAGRACFQTVLLTAICFLGPVVQHLLDVREGYSLLISGNDEPLMDLRDQVVAPLTEEFFFRGCLVRLLDAAELPFALVLIGSPVLFSLAHTHHYAEHVRRQSSKTAALAQVAFQVLYTSLFGAYATYVLLRTGSTLAAIAVHMFCNRQGFPDVSVLTSEDHRLSRFRVGLAALYVSGLVLFGVLLNPLTAGFQPIFNCMLN